MNEHTYIPTTSAKKQYILGHTEILERPIANIQRQFTTCSSVAWTASKPLSHLDNCAAISQTVCAIHGVHSLFIFHAPHKFLRELRLQKDCVWYSSMEYQAITIIFPKQIMMLQSQRLPLQHLHYTTLHHMFWPMECFIVTYWDYLWLLPLLLPLARMNIKQLHLSIKCEEQWPSLTMIWWVAHCKTCSIWYYNIKNCVFPSFLSGNLAYVLIWS